MRIILYGAAGRAGSRILRELVRRGHEVTSVTRNGTAPAVEGSVSVVSDDLSDVNKTADVLRGAEAVISAYAPPADNTDELVTVTRRFIEAVRKAQVPRFLMVGGAGALEVAPGMTLMDSGQLPAEWLPIARSHSKAYGVLRACDIDWTVLAPAAYFDPGERTGKFRLGTDNLIVDDKGQSRISMEDYAIAMADELEHPQHRRQRFSVGY